MVLGTSIIAIGTWLGSKLADKGFDILYDQIGSSTKINKDFKQSVVKVSKKLQKKHPNVLGGNMEYFFCNEDVFNELFKLLFKNAKVDESKISEVFDTSTLPDFFIRDFILELRDELLKNRLFNDILANNELYIAFVGMSSDVSKIAENSELTVKELKSINQKLEARLDNIFDISAFRTQYRTNALNNLSQINFIGLGIDISIKKDRKNLQDIFVKPFFQIQQRSYREVINNKFTNEELIRALKYDDIFKVSKRIVLLGNPGSGKSILLKSIICDILANKNDRFHKQFTDYLPFRIELRTYLAFKKDHGGNLLKYLVSNLEMEYQINNITESTLEHLLSSTPCLLFFDGLDEIFDIKDKIATKNDIENFHNNYNNLYSITTSRIIGYDDASLNDSFFTITIKNFDNEQIREYVTKWYNKEEDVTEVRERELNGFFTKMGDIDFELISNPLLLSLIVILYRNILKLPESKLEIYQSCTKTLVDKWDASKDLKFDLDNSLMREKDKLFADLAFWQYQHLSSKDNIKINYEKAKQTISDSISRLNLANEDHCGNLAEDFMNYAQKRSIYFDNNFTHKTFLEYYTAYWIYSNIEKKHKVKERDELINKYVDNPFWYIVLELLFNLIDKDQGDNDIIDDLISKIKNQGNGSYPFLLTILFKLKNLSYSIIKEIVRSSLYLLIEKGKTSVKDSNIDNSIFFGIISLFRQGGQAKKLILELLNIIEDQYKDQPKKIVDLYILYLEIESPLRGLDRQFQLSNKSNFEIACTNSSYLFTLRKYLFKEKTPSILDDLPNFIKNFGTRLLFKRMHAQHDRYELPSYFNGVISQILNGSKSDQLVNKLKKVNDNGLTYEIFIKNLNYVESYYIHNSDYKSLVNQLNKSNIFAIDLIIIFFLTYQTKSNLTKVSKMIQDSSKAKILIELQGITNLKQKTDYLKALFLNKNQILKFA